MIDVNSGFEKLTINVNVTFYKTPCHILGLDIVDVTGVHIMDVEGSLHKNKLSDKG